MDDSIPWQRMGPLYVPPMGAEQARGSGAPFRVYPDGLEALAEGRSLGRQVGHSGVSLVGGVVNMDHNLALTPSAWRGDDNHVGICDTMVREDPVAKALVMSWTLPILRSDWKIDPASDDPKDAEIADFVRANLWEYQAGGWMPWLEQAAAFVWRGFSLFEIVAKFDPGLGKTCLKKLAVILPRSVYAWNLYDGDAWGIEQSPPTSDPVHGRVATFRSAAVELPPEKLLKFTWGGDGNSPEGTSILRPCYGAWRQRRLYLKLEAAGFERGAFGIPFVEIAPTARQGDSAAVNEILRELRTGSRAWATLPPGYTLKFADFPMKGAEIREARIAAGRDMARAALASFLFTGEQSGSFALIRGQMDHYQMAIQGAADAIADQLNTGPRSLIKRLVDWNFEGVTEYPTISPGSLSVGDPSLLVTAIKAATEAAVLTPDEGVERAVRTALGLPDPPEVQPEDEMPEGPALVGPTGPTVPEQAAPEQLPEEAERSEQEALSALHLAELPPRLARSGRSLRPAEEVVRLDETLAKMQGTKEALARAIVAWRESVIPAYSESLGAAGKLSKLREVKVPKRGQLVQMIKLELRSAYRAGRASVKTEMERIEVDPSLADAIADGDVEVSREEGVAVYSCGPTCEHGQLHLLAAPKKRNRVRAPKVDADGKSVTDGLNPETTLDELASTTVGGVVDRMRGTAVTSAQAASQGGVITKAALVAATATAMKKLSVGVDLVQAQRDANTIFGLGRIQEARASGAGWGVYTNLLESKSCDPCLDKDGARFPISEADDYQTPNPDCLGGDQCNCLQIYIPGEPMR